MKTLRTIHKFCMVNLPYHNEDVKNFQRKLSLRSWLTEATKVPHFSSFFICAKFGPRYLTNLLIFCNKIF